jgi:uncharacterized protein YllA (UPF0747 family)
VGTALRRISDAIEQATAALASNPDTSGIIPVPALAGAKSSLLDRLRRLERRYVAAIKRREEGVMRQVAAARAHLYPDGERQERALNFLPMLARNGPALLERMRAAAGDHVRAVVSAAPGDAAAQAEPALWPGARS